MLKKIIALVLVAIMSFAVISCGPAPATTAPSPSAPPQTNAPSSQPDGGNAPASDTPGVTADKILIGGTCPLTGTVASAAQYYKGMDAYFNSINAEGGVHGRKIEFLYYDDAFEPAKTVANIKRLVEEDQAFSTVIHGTSCTLATLDYLIEQNVPNFSIGGSMSMLQNKVVFTAYIPFAEEGAAMGNFLVNERGYTKIAIIRANDDAGNAYREGVASAMEPKDLELIDVVYNTADVDYSSYVLQLMKDNPEAVVIQGLAATEAKILEQAETLGFNTQWLGFSGGSDKSIMELAPTASEGMIFSYFLPLLGTDDPKGIAHEQLVNEYLPGQNPNLFTMNGQAIAEVIVEALTRVGPDLTRDKFMEAIESITNWEDGILSSLSYSTELHAPSGQGIYFIQIRDGEFVRLT